MKRLLALFCSAVLLVTAMSVMPMTASAVAKGDINNDGRVDTLDVRLIMRGALGADTVTQKMIYVGDMSPDNKLTTADAQVLMRQVLTSDTSEAENVNYAYPTDENWWGEKSIAVLGDSISFGVGTSNDGTNSDVTQLTGGIPERSYVSYVKKAVQKANNGKMNYGFVSAYPTSWPGVARSEEIHGWPDRDNDANGDPAWSCDNNDDGNRLMSIGMTCTSAWKTITYRLRKDYYNKFSYFCVYYDAVSDGGTFCIADGNGGEVKDVNDRKSYVSTKLASGEERQTKRTAFYPLADCPKDANGIPKIIICHDGTSNPVTITGIGYYRSIDANTVTFNSFTRGGVSLMNLSDTVLRQAASADTLILGLGFNDFNFNHARVNKGEFKAKIDVLIEECNKNGTNVIVNDYAWANPELEPTWIDSTRTAHTTVKNELRRLAKETGGIYIDQQAIYGDDAVSSWINGRNEIGASSSMTKGDQVHPNHEGHKNMAKAIVEAMGLTWTESWVW